MARITAKQLQARGLGHLLGDTDSPNKPKAKARSSGRTIHKSGKMNKTEARFHVICQQLLADQHITHFGFEEVKLRLASYTFYEPDFLLVLPNNEHWFIETKGYLEDDASVKFKAICVAFPHYRFIMLQPAKSLWKPLMRSASAVPEPEWLAPYLT
jgi:hypothetical protein